MFIFRNHAYRFIETNTVSLQYLFILFQMVSIHNQQLMLIELYFCRSVGIEDCDTRTSVIEEKIFIVPRNTLEYWQINILSIQVIMTG